MNRERLKEIAERTAKAPQGPWVTDTFYHRSSTEVCLVLLDAGGIRLADTLNADDQTINQEVDEDSVSFYVSGACTDALEFAAKARSDIPDMLAHIHTLEEALRRLLLHDAGCVVSGEAGSGNPECCGYCFAKAALSPSPAARTETE